MVDTDRITGAAENVDGRVNAPVAEHPLAALFIVGRGPGLLAIADRGWAAATHHPQPSGTPMIRKLLTVFVLPRLIAFLTRRLTGRAGTPPRRGY